MATNGIVGTLFIYMNDGVNQHHIASLLSCALSVETEMKPSLHPDLYGWKHFTPGMQSWNAEGEVMQLVDSTTIQREDYLYKIEKYALEKTVLDFVFESPTGAQYVSEGYINNFQIGNAYEEGYKGAFGVQGITELVLNEPSNPCGVQQFAGESGDFTTPHYLGTTAGWIKLDWETFVEPDQLQIIYDNVVVADTGGLVSGTGSLHWEYPATAGLPRSVGVRVYAPAVSTFWNYTLHCPDPSNEP